MFIAHWPSQNPRRTHLWVTEKHFAPLELDIVLWAYVYKHSAALRRPNAVTEPGAVATGS
jgi:hypothetical protein